MTTLCTFNINNLFLRYKFGRIFPGDMSSKSQSEDVGWGYLPLYKPGLFDVFSPEQRELAALALKLPNGKFPDIICLQEVESLLALRAFNEHYLEGYYPYAALIDSRDMRQIDVGILSTKSISSLRSNVDMPNPEDKDFPWLFSRDCLEATLELNKSGSQFLTVFINHFKSKLVQGKTKEDKEKATKRASAKRKLQADTVAKILKSRFPGSEYDSQLFAVVGDMNDEPVSSALKSLISNAKLENVIDRLDEDERWTHYYKSAGQVSQFDYLLLSPALARASKNNKPIVNRKGLGFRDLSKKDQEILPNQVSLVKDESGSDKVKIDFRFERLSGVSASIAASDHCPFTIEF